MLWRCRGEERGRAKREKSGTDRASEQLAVVLREREKREGKNEGKDRARLGGKSRKRQQKE